MLDSLDRNELPVTEACRNFTAKSIVIETSGAVTMVIPGVFFVRRLAFSHDGPIETIMSIAAIANWNENQCIVIVDPRKILQAEISRSKYTESQTFQCFDQQAMAHIQPRNTSCSILLFRDTLRNQVCFSLLLRNRNYDDYITSSLICCPLSIRDHL